MGTNYYLIQGKACQSCGEEANKREDRDKRHIGKNSAGWSFTFRGYDAITSEQDWKKEIGNDGCIVNEYGEDVSVEQFWTLVESKRGHTPPCNETYPSDHDYWIDNCGNQFSRREFS